MASRVEFFFFVFFFLFFFVVVVLDSVRTSQLTGDPGGIYAAVLLGYCTQWCPLPVHLFLRRFRLQFWQENRRHSDHKAPK